MTYLPRCARMDSATSPRRAWFGPVLMLVIASSLLLTSSVADAQSRRRGRSAAAAAAARKKQMIASIQKQLANARQVLAAAESQAQMSQSEVDQAVAKLSELRTALESDEEDATDAAMSLREIEADILAKQSFSSEYKLTQQALEDAKEHVHAMLHHKFPQLPKRADVEEGSCLMTDLSALSSEQRKKVEEDEKYLAAKLKMESLGKKLSQIRQKLFEADSEWTQTRKEVADAVRKVREETAKASATGVGSLDDRKTLRTAHSIAAAARTAIAQYEALLARLGAKPAAPAGTKSSTGKK